MNDASIETPMEPLKAAPESVVSEGRIKQNKKPKLTKKAVSRLVFYCVGMAIPLTLLGIFYFGVNIKSIIMSFQSWDMVQGRYIWSDFTNFKQLFSEMGSNPTFGYMFRNTMLGFFIPEAVCFVPSIMTSYYVYKKFRCYRFFRVVMYLPSILSVLALSIVQKYMLELGYPAIVEALTGKTVDGLLTNPNTTIPALIGVSIWFGFCQGVMIYPATMSSIPDSCIEAAQIDGCSVWKEFTRIVVPMIWPTIVVKFVADLCGMMSIDLQVFNMLGENADGAFQTVGYYLYTGALHANSSSMPMLSAFGLFLSVIMVPVVLCVRKLLLKVGPKTDM